MKLLAAILLLAPFIAVAETFIGPTSTTNRFFIATNEVVLIRQVLYSGSANDTVAQVTLNGVTHPTRIQFTSTDRSIKSLAPTAIAGECELVITNNLTFLIERITNASVTSVFLNTSSTNTVSLDEGQTIRVFPPIGTSFSLHLKRGNLSSGVIAPIPSGPITFPLEVSGPIEIELANSSASNVGLLTYSINDPVLRLEEMGVVQGPTGNSQIIIEKSGDLMNWATSGVMEIRDEQKQFYRLRFGN